MKLSARDATGYFKRPDPAKTGLLIYGGDAMRVALKRQEVIAALIGPNGDDEMRLARLPAGELRKDPAMLLDAIKAQSFFPGPRVAFVEDATDTLTGVIEAALSDWAPGDAQVIVTAGQLTAKAKLRKLFEGHPNAYAVGLYDDPPSRGEIEDELARAGVRDVSNDAMTDLVNLSRELGPGDFRQVIEKLGLYKYGDDSQTISADVQAVAPQSTEAALDDVLNIVAEGRAGEIGPVMQKLEAQGVNPVSLCIGAMRHFRALYTAASDPGGAQQGIARMRPPIFGPRRDRMLRQAQGWGAPKLEKALGLLTDTDLLLRSAGQRAPAMALVERALVRLAMMGQRR
ncbi:DNA polymerase III subunit delta [Rhodalgimonas zhirmunskyi]|uniref:DNA-directed DNA polymerase n=1 Tax=Rhodalgimonas zhirmunskyi TaxID=2964767 RepID=A0AAJ1U9C3_9RHOB|nr:DNA polymerase III subunit delta [Rhodoalgimonas zhirmunskyi]MDQ2094185.1 DNA polymerase III subunit delta [Rhodoalgimonas zhirmunskyi]